MRKMFSIKQIMDMVAPALKGKDINVEGITSKGIANTGNFGNIGDVAISGDLSVTGAISGKPIIETMEGYSANKVDTLNWNVIYAGVCKNGNKLTLAVSGAYTYATGDSTENIISFVLPEDVYNKLQPYAQSGFSDILDTKKIPFFSTLEQSKDLYISVRKFENNLIGLAIRSPSSGGLTNGTTYNFRCEVTFLLNDNLLSE